jgi:dihydrofolate reductase
VSAALPQPIAMVIVAAVADNGVIGRDNSMPWRLSSDLKRFKALTVGKPVVMGRKTYLSIGRTLPGRTNIVVSRNAEFAAPGLVVAGGFETALAVARGDALRRDTDEIIVIGGTEVFLQAMPLAERLEITHVHCEPAGDTLFPPIDREQWREVARSEHNAGTRDDAPFAYATYVRADM